MTQPSSTAARILLGQDIYERTSVMSPEGAGTVTLSFDGGETYTLTALAAENLAERLTLHAEFARKQVSEGSST